MDGNYRILVIPLILSCLMLVLTISIEDVAATDRDVGPWGHTYTNINDAVDAADPGDNIHVYDDGGTPYVYNENVVLTKTNLNLTAKGQVTVNAKDSGGPVIQMSMGSAIRNFTITGGSLGILLSADNTIENNTISGNGGGLRGPLDTNNNKIINNIFSYNSGEVIYIDSNFNNLISGNKITDNAGLAINAQGCDQLRITGNIVNNNPRGFAINCNLAIISNNILNNNKDYGIGLYDSNYCQITENTITKSECGIHLYGASWNQITRNTITGNNIGIMVDEYVSSSPGYSSVWISSNNNIVENDISENGDGISFVSVFSTPSGNKVNFNRIAANTNWGLVNYSNENVDATNNWWGSNSTPINKILGYVNVVYKPWLVLKISASKSVIPFGGTSTITAYLTKNSNGVDTSSLGHIPDGTPITFPTDKGSIGSKSLVKYTLNGKATATFTGTQAPSIATISAALDDEKVNTKVSVYAVIPYKYYVLVKYKLNKWKQWIRYRITIWYKVRYYNKYKHRWEYRWRHYHKYKYRWGYRWGYKYEARYANRYVYP